jgi:hypothetical protein
MNMFDYKVLSLESVLALCRYISPDECPDSYMAEDAESKTLRDLLSNGYRWVRTDGGYAVFEKSLSKASACHPPANNEQS